MKARGSDPVGHGAAPDARHVERYRDTPFDPVFIIGDHRSGTTVLYKVLAATGAFNVLTAYHVIRWDCIVDDHLGGRSEAARVQLADEFSRLGLSNRGIDDVRVTPDLPEEYGFLLARRHRQPALTSASRSTLVEIAEKIRYTGHDRPVLLKNPWDATTFAEIRSALPRARFIFIHRHPMHVMQSQLAALRYLLSRRNEYLSMLSPQYDGLFSRPLALAFARALATTRFGLGPRIVGRHVVKVARYYLTHAGAAAGDGVELRYEDLCSSPDAQVGRVLEFLGLSPLSPVSVGAMIQPRPAQVLPEIRARYERLRPRLADYCARWGYR